MLVFYLPKNLPKPKQKPKCNDKMSTEVSNFTNKQNFKVASAFSSNFHFQPFLWVQVMSKGT